MKAAGPEKYEHIKFTPPKGVAEAAAKGLELRRKASPSNRGGFTPAQAAKEGIGSGVQRAVNLKNQNTISPDVIRQMVAFFARHEKNKNVPADKKSEPWNAKGYVAWLLWGGDPGRQWAEKVRDQMDAADAKASKKASLPRTGASGALLTGPEYGRAFKTAKGHIDRLVSENRYAEAMDVFEGLGELFRPVYIAASNVKISRADEQRKSRSFLEKVALLRRMTQQGYIRETVESDTDEWARLSVSMDYMEDVAKYLTRNMGRLDGYVKISKAFQHGPFRIVNYYGFQEGEMQAPLTTLDAAAEAIKRAGFGGLLYGSVFLVGAKGQGFAGRYVAATDNITLNIDTKYRKEAVYTLIHDFGHRHWYKVLSDAEREAYTDAYHGAAPSLTVSDRTAILDALVKADFIVAKAIRILPGHITELAGSYLRERLVQVDLRMLRSDWLRQPSIVEALIVMPRTKLYFLEQMRPQSVSNYGRTDVREDYAEVFAHIVTGLLDGGAAYDRFMTALGRGRTAALEPDWMLRMKKGWAQQAAAALRAVDLLDVTTAFQDMIRWIDLLITDLLLDKGFYYTETTLEPIKAIKSKAVSDIRDVREILENGESRVFHIKEGMNPQSHTFAMSNGAVFQFYKERDTQSPMRAANRSGRELLQETLDKATHTFNRKFIRNLNAIVNKSGGSVDFGSGPLEYSVGKVQVVYQDGPKAVTPLRLLDDPARGRISPEAYVKPLQLAQTLLQRRGLDFLWYGNVFIQCANCGGTNENGAHFGVGARYSISQDKITVYDRPNSKLTELLIHEIGHRYYFRFMDGGDRARFDSYFGQVSATSDYGATSSVEDFAEVFAAYVMGHDLDRDQIERFKAFMGRTKRTARSQRYAPYTTESYNRKGL